MIYMRMAGGLGNQLFQYAFAKSYQLKHNVPVNLDTSVFSTHKNYHLTLRHFKLNSFNISLPSTTHPPFWAKQYQSRYWRSAHDMLFSPFIIKDEEKGFQKKYIESFFSTKLFIGYFQDPQYFNSIRKELLAEITPKTSSSDNIEKLRNEIKTSESVSLHVRRGDYLLPQNNSIHGVLNLDYYQNAINYIKSKIHSPLFYVFSDDIEWCKSIWKNESRFIFIDSQFQSTDTEELMLMSSCSHNIIANSSFSWWGAWLNQNNQKIVIAPNNWFSSPQLMANWNIYPKDWIKF